MQTPALINGDDLHEDLTRSAVRGGWFYTRDRGYRDGEGRIVLVVGRGGAHKGGLKAQQDVENAATAHPQYGTIARLRRKMPMLVTRGNAAIARPLSDFVQYPQHRDT